MKKKDYDKEYRAKNKKTIAERRRKYYETNKEYILNHVLEYRATKKGKEVQAKSSRQHISKFPEKFKTRAKFTYFRTKNGIKTPDGYHFHHYSYNIKDYMDVVLLPSWLHREVHSKMTYLSSCKYHMTKAGQILNTKFKHLSFINGVRKSLSQNKRSRNGN